MKMLCEVIGKVKKFTKETAGYQELRIYQAFKEFFDSYLLERNFEKTLSLVDDDFHSLGTGGDELAADKSSFTELLQAELEAIGEPIEYKVKSIFGKEIADGIWNILAEMEILLPNGEAEKITYDTRFTGCFIVSDDKISVMSTHMSEASRITEEREFLPLKYASNNQSIDKAKAEQIVFDIMSKAMPGGYCGRICRRRISVIFCK